MSVSFNYNDKPFYPLLNLGDVTYTGNNFYIHYSKNKIYVLGMSIDSNDTCRLCKCFIPAGEYIIKRTNIDENCFVYIELFGNINISAYFYQSSDNNYLSFDAKTDKLIVKIGAIYTINLALVKEYETNRVIDFNFSRLSDNNIKNGLSIIPDKSWRLGNIDYFGNTIKVEKDENLGYIIRIPNDFTPTEYLGGVMLSDYFRLTKGTYYVEVKSESNEIEESKSFFSLEPCVELHNKIKQYAIKSNGNTFKVEDTETLCSVVFKWTPNKKVNAGIFQLKLYKLCDLNTIFISGAGYVDYPFKNIDRESQLGWDAPVWGSNLKRTLGFTLETVDSAAFGTVARVELNLKYLNSEDYKVLADMSKERAVYVTYFNRETGKWVERQEMSFTSQEIEKLYATNTNYIGVFNTKIKLVATNRDKAEKTYTIKLNSNYRGSTEAAVVATANWCEGFELSDDIFTQSGKSIKYWSTTADTLGGKTYLANSLLTVTDNLELYAIWE